MDALQPRMDHIEQHLYRDLDEMRRLHELLANKNSNPQSASPLVDGTAKNIKGNENSKFLQDCFMSCLPKEFHGAFSYWFSILP